MQTSPDRNLKTETDPLRKIGLYLRRMDVCIWMYQDVPARQGGWDGVGCPHHQEVQPGGCPHYQEVQPGEPTIVKKTALFPIF